MYSSISSRNVGARDGTWVVYCAECREPICRTTLQMGKTICELCARVQAGEKLSNEAIQLYRRSKIGVLGLSNLPVVNLAPDGERDMDDAGPTRTQGNGFLRALGKLLERIPGKAEQVVKDKTRGRLFDMVDLEKLGDAEEEPTPANLGSIERVDALLQAERNK